MSTTVTFVRNVNDNVLIIKDVEDDEIIYTKMTELGIEHKYLDSVTAREFGVKKIKNLEDKIIELQAEYTEVFKITAPQMWLTLLKKLEKFLLKEKICLINSNTEDDRKMKNLVPKLQLKISNKKEEKKIDTPNETNSPTIKKKDNKKTTSPSKKTTSPSKKINSPIKKNDAIIKKDDAITKKKKKLIEVKNSDTPEQ